MNMLLTMLLSRVLGIFLIILGALILLRRRYYLSVFAEFGRQRLTRTVISMGELLAGVFLVVIHNQWSSPAAGLVSLIGWMAVLESLVYLALPDRFVEKFLKTFNTAGWYLCGGLLAIATGCYLVAYGFGCAG
ncbi:MAG TPA: hypothetical protein VFX02_09750 [Gammaproteobacteria bacterium]|nr:hypothetical protein [Gammaproteobacteria bacterium]